MERRHTLTGVAGLQGFAPSGRKVLEWLALLVVLLLIAYAVRTAALPISPAVSMAPEGATISTAAQENAIKTSSHRTVVMITGIDATSGEKTQVQCVTDSDRITSDALQVDLNDLGDITSRICVGGQSNAE